MFYILDCTKIKETLGWSPVWTIESAMEELVKWYKIYADGVNLEMATKQQITTYLSDYRAKY